VPYVPRRPADPDSQAAVGRVMSTLANRAAQLQRDGATIPQTARALGVPCSEVERILSRAAEAHALLHKLSRLHCTDPRCPQNQPAPDNAHRHADGHDYLPHPSVSCDEYDSRVEVADTYTEIA
jgi:hypothetical protein